MTDATSPIAQPTPINPMRGRGFVIWGIVLVVLSLLIVGGGIATIVFGATGINAANDLPRAAVPGETALKLTAGTKKIYLENTSQTALDDTGARFVITSDASGDELTIVKTSSTTTETYSDSKRAGKLVAKVNIPADGTYTVSTEGTEGASIAIGNLNVAGVAIGIVAGVFIIFFGGFLGLIGLILLIVGLVKRSNTKKQLVAGA
jgi:hypothetical protein